MDAILKMHYMQSVDNGLHGWRLNVERKRIVDAISRHLAKWAAR